MNGRALLLFVWFASCVASTASAVDTVPRRVEPFNRDWRFAKGAEQGAEAVEFDDTNWEHVRLPHDWAIAAPTNRRAIRTPANFPGAARAGIARRSRCPPPTRANACISISTA